ncbi:HAD family hydrolase [Arthrobacter roseus]|uniref:HAD family hydrolase n=1 Tax=Arthrobacter roseus TaxID=136274 RepID=UPI00196268B6|nr:HAD family hydrolase [Arthrobacter roseus]MBM7847257.1 Cof subfamily protein (haloacid dehalogenase superfamily) [Arthrobacter roseus]
MRLVASDLDGTIIGRDGKISDRTVRAFHACRNAGIEIVFVTGRPPRWLDPLREQIGHTGRVICSNGAALYDLENERVLTTHLLSSENVLEARRIIKGLYPAATFSAEIETGFRMEHGFMQEHSPELLGTIEPAPLKQSLVGVEGVIKFLAREPTVSPDEFLATVRPAISDFAATTHSSPGVALLEMSLSGMDKGVALADYARQLDIDANDVVAFGDMPNDIQMLTWAGHGYAMESGHADAKAATDLLAPAFENDGVAQVLEERLAALRRND